MNFDNVNVNVSGDQSIIKALQNYNTIILKPNIMDNRNVLTQEMISEKHTKYIIKWNYSLEDAIINVPKDCIIEFSGGTIDNGTIVGNNTILIYSKPIDEVCPAKRQGTFIYNTTVADEEDITSENGNLKFKDRPAINGMGKKILRKNIVDGKNILTQDMINQPNTIYEIRYEFDLNGKEIIVPNDCVLKFEGGYLKNGKLSGELCFSGYYNDVLRDISLQKIKNISVIDYRYIFNNSLNNIFIIKNSKDLTKAINTYNSSSIEQYWVLTNTIVTNEITLTGTANLTIIGYNNAELIYATSVYSVKKSDNILDCIHNSYKLSNYDLFHDDFSRILFSGEKDVYSEDVDMQVYEYNDGIYNSLGSSKELYNTITKDNNRYAGFKLSDMLLNKLFGTTILSNCNLSVEKCVNIKLNYTTGYWNYRTGIHSINNGYVYFKNTNISSCYWYHYNGDKNYNTPMRYSIINCTLLKDSSTVTIDENNTLYAPMTSVNLYRTDEGTSLFNIAKGSTVDILNLTIKYAYYAVNSARTVHIKDCKFFNNFIALNLNGATNSIIKSNKFLNSYASAAFIGYCDDTSFVFNEVKNSGLIDRNRWYAVSFGYSNNGLIAYNTFVNFYTAIGLTAGREHLEDKYNCAAICYNKLYIEEDYINNLNSISDYGVIYLAPFQKGTCSINGKTFNRSKIHANIICNSCASYRGNGIYLDDGAYNSSITENYIIGINNSITMRYVKVNSNPYLNTNNEISHNIVVDGTYNIGKPINGDNSWNIDYNYIIANFSANSTFTYLSDEEKNKFIIISYYKTKNNIIFLPIAAYDYLFYYIKVDKFLMNKINLLRIERGNITYNKIINIGIRYSTKSVENPKYIKLDIKGHVSSNFVYDIILNSYYDSLIIKEIRYDSNYNVFSFAYANFTELYKSLYYKFDKITNTLSILLEIQDEKAINTLDPYISLKLRSIIRTNNTPETTDLNYLYRIGYPYPLSSDNSYEILDNSTPLDNWTLYYSTYKSNKANIRLNASLSMNNENLQVKIDSYNDHAPTIPYIFSSLRDAKYDRKFAKILYYKNKALIQGYAIDESRTQYKEYNLLGKPILNEGGTFEKKPTVEQGVEIGFAYFCTNKQTEEGTTDGIMIYHKGNDVWVDALGRVIS